LLLLVVLEVVMVEVDNKVAVVVPVVIDHQYLAKVLAVEAL
jgi:hypothetical protein